MNYDRLPQDLKDDALFCLWKYEERDGRRTKVPYDPATGERARANDPGTFTNFERAAKVLERRPGLYDGPGIGLFGDLVGVDIDHCIGADGTLSPLARDVLAALDSYAEKSPSGEGIHILCRAPGMSFDAALYYTKRSDLGLEIYVAGKTARYLTCTGDALTDTPVRDCTPEVLAVLEKYMKKPGAATRDREVHMEATECDVDDETAAMDDAELLERMRRSSTWSKIERLLNGDWSDGYPSQSEADMALCNYLAFYTGKDPAQMDRIFRESGLMRGKWDEERQGSTYGALTIRGAIAGCTSVWTPDYRGEPEGGGVGRALDFLRSADMAHSSRYRRDDVGAGNLLADYLRPFCRPVPEQGGWFFYDGARWGADTGEVRVAEAAKDMSRALLAYAAQMKDDDERERVAEWGRRWSQRNRRVTYIQEAESVHPISMSAFDRDLWLLNVQNGTLDLRTGELRPHDPDDLITHLAPVDYDPQARCPRWDRFVEEIMAPGIGEVTDERETDAREKADFLQRYLGYCLSGDTSAEALLVMYGPTTRNGKSVCVETVRAVLGDYARGAQPETVATAGQRDGRAPTEDIARLAGARMVSIAEIPENMRLDANEVKRLTGRDKVTARYLYQGSFEFYPQFKLLLHTNHLPACSDLSVFDSGRMLVLTFDRHFAPEEQDRGLKDELRRPENLSGVLNWMLDGLRAYQVHGLEAPRAVRAAVDAYRADMDTVALFVEERLEKDPHGEETPGALYAAYREWCLENGRQAMGKQKFNRALERLGIRAERGRLKAGGYVATIIRGYRLNWAA